MNPIVRPGRMIDLAEMFHCRAAKMLRRLPGAADDNQICRENVYKTNHSSRLTRNSCSLLDPSSALNRSRH